VLHRVPGRRRAAAAAKAAGRSCQPLASDSHLLRLLLFHPVRRRSLNDEALDGHAACDTPAKAGHGGGMSPRAHPKLKARGPRLALYNGVGDTTRGRRASALTLILASSCCLSSSWFLFWVACGSSEVPAVLQSMAKQKAFECKLRGHNTGPCEAKVSTKPAYASVSFQNQPQATAEEAPHRDTRAETTHSQTARESKGEERNQEAETANVEPRVGSETQGGGKPQGRRRGTSLVCQGRPVHGLLGPIVPIVNVSVCMRGAAFSHQSACPVSTATHHSRATTTDPGMSATTTTPPLPCAFFLL